IVSASASGCRPFFRRFASCCGAAVRGTDVATATRSLIGVGLVATTAGAVAAAGVLVHCGPGPSFRLVMGNTLLHVTFLDMFGFTLLLVGVFFFTSAHVVTSAIRLNSGAGSKSPLSTNKC